MRGLVMLVVGAACLGLVGCGGTSSENFGTISTVAGNNKAGYSGDGGAATSAQLNQPSCVVVDGAGNLYFGDLKTPVVRKVTAAGTISTYVGNGTAGYTGDGGQAAAAEIQWVGGCALDAAGNLFLADTGNNVVRKVTASTGVITTVAGTGAAGFAGDGGPAVAAQLNQPWGVLVDAAGNIYIGDTLNYRVRKVDTAGNITTIAGKGTFGYSGDGGNATDAQLYNPEGMLLLASGDLLVADEGNSSVRKISAGKISTFAGNGRPGYTGNGGSATAAELTRPTSLTLDSAGNVYISDAGNNQIRRVKPDGSIEAVAGTGDVGFKGDGKAAVDAEMSNPRWVTLTGAGVMYIADTNNAVVRKVAK